MSALKIGDVVKFPIWSYGAYRTVTGKVLGFEKSAVRIEYDTGGEWMRRIQMPITDQIVPAEPDEKLPPHGGIQVRMVQRRNKRTKSSEPADRQYKQYWFRWEHKGIKHSAYIRNSILWEVEESIANGKHWQETLKMIRGSRNGQKK